MDGFGNNSDWMGVTIDSRNDDYNGYFCGVNASGAIIDVALAGSDEYDRTWDAVWNVGIAFNENGWAAEHHLAEYANVRECRLRHHLISH